MRQLFKIIRASNFDDEGPKGDQYFVLEICLSKDIADKIAFILNADPDRSNEDWYRVVSYDYKLQKFEP